MSLSLRPSQRIRKRGIFQLIFKQGRCLKGRMINVWALKGEGSASMKNAPMLGVVVTRKTSKLATKRNLWKRRIREAFRQNQLKVRKGQMIVVQARFLSEVPTSQELKDELFFLLKKTGSLK